jgi:hypothetical protein
MRELIYMLAALGLAICVQHKMVLPRWTPVEQFIRCALCQGFWAGWVTWLASWFISGEPLMSSHDMADWKRLAVSGLVWAFACGALSFLVSKIVAWLEDSLLGG